MAGPRLSRAVDSIIFGVCNNFMNLVNHSDGELVVKLARGELQLLCNSINEALEAVEAWEFQTRTGATPEEASLLLKQIKEILKMTSVGGE